MAFDVLGREVAASGTSWGAYTVVYAPDGSKLGLMSGSAAEDIEIPLPGGGAAAYSGVALAYYWPADWLGSAALTSSPARTLLSSTHLTPFGFDQTGAGAGYRSFTGAKQWTDTSHAGGSTISCTASTTPSRAAGGPPIRPDSPL